MQSASEGGCFFTSLNLAPPESTQICCTDCSIFLSLLLREWIYLHYNWMTLALSHLHSRTAHQFLGCSNLPGDYETNEGRTQLLARQLTNTISTTLNNNPWPPSGLSTGSGWYWYWLTRESSESSKTTLDGNQTQVPGWNETDENHDKLLHISVRLNSTIKLQDKEWEEFIRMYYNPKLVKVIWHILQN